MKRKTGTAVMLLWVVLWCAAGSFLAYGAYKYTDYKTHPEIYEAWSAPWYTGLLLYGAAVAAVMAVCLIALWWIRRKNRS